MWFVFLIILTHWSTYSWVNNLSMPTFIFGPRSGYLWSLSSSSSSFDDLETNVMSLEAQITQIILSKKTPYILHDTKLERIGTWLMGKLTQPHNTYWSVNKPIPANIQSGKYIIIISSQWRDEACQWELSIIIQKQELLLHDLR